MLLILVPKRQRKRDQEFKASMEMSQEYVRLCQKKQKRRRGGKGSDRDAGRSGEKMGPRQNKL